MREYDQKKKNNLAIPNIFFRCMTFSLLTLKASLVKIKQNISCKKTRLS